MFCDSLREIARVYQGFHSIQQYVHFRVALAASFDQDQPCTSCRVQEHAAEHQNRRYCVRHLSCSGKVHNTRHRDQSFVYSVLLRHIVSDRAKGLVPAVAGVLPEAFHYHCTQHLVENFEKNWEEKPRRHSERHA